MIDVKSQEESYSHFICAFRRKKNTKFRERAQERLEKELDVVNFVRKFIKVSIILETIFTGVEKTLVRNNKKFTLKQPVSEESEE